MRRHAIDPFKFMAEMRFVAKAKLGNNCFVGPTLRNELLGEPAS